MAYNHPDDDEEKSIPSAASEVKEAARQEVLWYDIAVSVLFGIVFGQGGIYVTHMLGQHWFSEKVDWFSTEWTVVVLVNLLLFSLIAGAYLWIALRGFEKTKVETLKKLCIVFWFIPVLVLAGFGASHLIGEVDRNPESNETQTGTVPQPASWQTIVVGPHAEQIGIIRPEEVVEYISPVPFHLWTDGDGSRHDIAPEYTTKPMVAGWNKIAPLGERVWVQMDSVAAQIQIRITRRK